MKHPNATRVAFVSLGCAKNLVDSETMLGRLAEAGCVITADEADADAIVVNTCGFLAASRDEAVDVINEVARYKETGRLQRLVVAGCLVQRDGERLLDLTNGVDALVGVNNREDVVAAVMQGLKTHGRGRKNRLKTGSTRHRLETGATHHGLRTLATQVDRFLGDYYPRIDNDTARLRITPRHYAYLRISEGCDQKCTFCTIPSIRGPMHCKPPEAIIAEARELVADGAVEINLIGQDTTSYGADFGYDAGLAGLLHQLNNVDGIEWLRLMYVYPSVMTDDIIDAMADCDRVVKYIDMPLQHINDRMLKAMHRRVTRAETERLLEKIRDRIPGVSLRTTMIAGFPGETDAEFDELVRFVQDFRFDALGVFPYSLEPETPAGRMKDQLPEDAKQQRVDAIMRVQQDVAFRLADERIGSSFDALIEGPPTDGLLPARHAGQAPEVDSATWIKIPNITNNGAPRPGTMLNVRCTSRVDYDLIAQPTRVGLAVLPG